MPSATAEPILQFRVDPALAAPIAAAARALAAQPPRQERLSGIHNPFGPAAALVDNWKFLDLCESAGVLDAVESLIGRDIVLWDSELYLDAAGWERARAYEGRHWPADPLAGAVVDFSIASGRGLVFDVSEARSVTALESGAHYAIRYMPSTSRYNRDPRFGPNRVAMEERPLVNHMNRPIWLARGEDRAGSDFSTGFTSRAPGWAHRTGI